MPDLINVLLGEAVVFKQANVETVLAAGLYPASGSFYDVAGYHRVGFIVVAGTLGADQTWQVQQATTISGTPKDLTDATVVSLGTGGDNKNYIIEFDVARLDTNGGYRFVTLKNTGGTTGNYAAILFFGIGKRIPVTNDSVTKLVG